MGLFDKLESKLEQGVNGAFARAFKSEVQPVEIASGIRRAMDDRAASVGKGKRPIVPNLFTVELSPTDYDRLCEWGDELDDELIASAQEHADEQRYLPGGPLTIVLTESETLETGVFRLRPATAKAADAVAHQRQHPRVRHDADSHDSSAGAPAGGTSRRNAQGSGRGASAYDGAPSVDARHDAWGDDAYAGYDDARGHDEYAGHADGYGTAVHADISSTHPEYDDRHGAGQNHQNAPGGPQNTAAGTGRSFGVRIKDYLLGGYASEPQEHGQTQPRHDAADGTSANSAYAADDHTGYDAEHAHDGHGDDHGYDNATHSGHPNDGWGQDAWDDDDHGTAAHTDHRAAGSVDHGPAGHEANSGHSYAGHADSYDGNEEYASSDDAYRNNAYRNDEPHDAYDYDDYAGSPAYDPSSAHGSPRPAAAPSGRSGQVSCGASHGRSQHAWDDDDSDYGDPTGYEPAPATPSHRPRAMTPRERPWLKIEGQRYPLLGAITILGRDDDADIVVDDPGVSRRHSEIRITHDGPHLVMSVRDLGSTNGTYVNGDLIDSAHVHDGDRLTLGRTPMTIHLGDRP